MKTDTIVLSWRNDSLERALYLANLVADQMGISESDAGDLKRLTEETLSMIESILGRYVGELFFVIDGKRCELTIQSEEEVNDDLKDVLIRMSSSGENAFKPTVADKIKNLFKNDGSIDDIANGIEEPDEFRHDMVVIRTKDNEVWDESEKAILHHFADEICVGVRKNKTVVKVVKQF